ncbi:hypothetical protein SABR111722_18065 [Saccharibacillus brassicae]
MFAHKVGLLLFRRFRLKNISFIVMNVKRNGQTLWILKIAKMKQDSLMVNLENLLMKK